MDDKSLKNCSEKIQKLRTDHDVVKINPKTDDVRFLNVPQKVPAWLLKPSVDFECNVLYFLKTTLLLGTGTFVALREAAMSVQRKMMPIVVQHFKELWDFNLVLPYFDAQNIFLWNTNEILFRDFYLREVKTAVEKRDLLFVLATVLSAFPFANELQKYVRDVMLRGYDDAQWDMLLALQADELSSEEKKALIERNWEAIRAGMRNLNSSSPLSEQDEVFTRIDVLKRFNNTAEAEKWESVLLEHVAPVVRIARRAELSHDERVLNELTGSYEVPSRLKRLRFEFAEDKMHQKEQVRMLCKAGMDQIYAMEKTCPFTLQFSKTDYEKLDSMYATDILRSFAREHGGCFGGGITLYYDTQHQEIVHKDISKLAVNRNRRECWQKFWIVDVSIYFQRNYNLTALKTSHDFAKASTTYGHSNALLLSDGSNSKEGWFYEPAGFHATPKIAEYFETDPDHLFEPFRIHGGSTVCPAVGPQFSNHPVCSMFSLLFYFLQLTCPQTPPVQIQSALARLSPDELRRLIVLWMCFLQKYMEDKKIKVLVDWLRSNRRSLGSKNRSAIAAQIEKQGHAWTWEAIRSRNWMFEELYKYKPREREWFYGRALEPVRKEDVPESVRVNVLGQMPEANGYTVQVDDQRRRKWFYRGERVDRSVVPNVVYRHFFPSSS